MIQVSWSASDGGSGVFGATLWVKYGSNGTWTDTGQSQRGESSGVFTYTPTQGDGTYYLATVAEDWMGNVETAPTSKEDCPIHIGPYYVYLPVALGNYRIWDAYYEENDHWLGAYGPLASGQTYLAYPDDTEDYYYFELSAQATVSISVENYTPTSSNGTVALYGPVVGDEQDEEPFDYYAPRGHSFMSLGPHSLAPGKYYIRVYTTSNHSTTQLYRLTVTY